MNTVLFVALALLAGAAAVWFLIRLERTGRRLAVVQFLLVLLVVDSVLYPNPFDVPAGLLHPEIGGVSFRLYEVVIGLALVARLIADPPGRLPTPMLLWIAFGVWLIALGLVGLLRGHSLDLVTFEAKAVVYLGALALTAGVSGEEWRRSRGPSRLVAVAAVLSAAILVMVRGDVVLDLDLPALPGASFGEMGTDTATLFAALGVIALAAAMCQSDSRAPALAAAAPLLLAPVAAEQRAAVLGLLASLGVLGLAWVSRTGRRRVTATRREILGGLLIVSVLVIVPVVVGAASGRAVAVPFRDSIETVVDSQGKEMSAEGRRNQWIEAEPLIRARPIWGHGLGTTYYYFEPSRYRYVETNLTHNIIGDLLLRTGAVGVVLFLLALGSTLREGFRAWRAHVDETAAALALGCLAVVTGLLAKGMVESLFEKFRLATLLGLLLGIMLSLGASAHAAGRAGGKEISAWGVKRGGHDPHRRKGAAKDEK
jgi:O-antigen ligase